MTPEPSTTARESLRNAAAENPRSEPARSEDTSESEPRFRRKRKPTRHPSRPCQTCGRRIAWLWSVCRVCGTPDPDWRILNDPRIDRSGDCWLWLGSRTRAGYGVFDDTYAHRISWEQTTGKTAAGLEIIHSCDNPPCINPAHLRLATHAENMADAMAKGRMNLSGLIRRGEWTHCKRGHEFTEENTHRDSKGVRSCRICRRAYKRARRGQ